MKDWLAGLDQRQRLMLYAAAGAVLVLLVYLFLLSPFHASHDRLQQSVAEQRETLQWMTRSAAQVRQLQGANPAAAEALGGSSLLSVTDSAARSSGLGSSLKKVEPEGSQGVRIWLDGAEFDAVIGWLDIMGTRYGANVETISIEKSGAPGRVNVRLNLQIPGS